MVERKIRWTKKLSLLTFNLELFSLKYADVLPCESTQLIFCFSLLQFSKTAGSPVLAKIPIQWCAMNVFLQYMCDLKFEYSDPKFQKVVKEFDLIFEDINNGHPTDFLPWLSPFFNSHLMAIKELASNIRTFILEHIINEQVNNECPDKTKNVLEGLLANHKVITLK